MKPCLIVTLWYMGLLFLLAATPAVGTTADFMTIVKPSFTDLLHIPAYGLLAWLWILSLRSYQVARMQAVMVAMIMATMCGAFMELFQTLVPGRDPSVFDCFLDVAGILMFTGAYLIVNLKVRSRGYVQG